MIRVTDPLLQESVCASGSEAKTVNDDHRRMKMTAINHPAQKKIKAYKGTDCTKATEDDFVMEFSIEAPAKFVSGNCGGLLQSGNWIDASNANTGKSVFHPRLGLSSAPSSGFVCIRYASSKMYGAAVKETGVNAIRPQITYDITTNTWVNP